MFRPPPLAASIDTIFDQRHGQGWWLTRDSSPDSGKAPYRRSLIFQGPFPENARFRLELPPNLVDDAHRPLENAARFPLEVATDEYPPLAKFSGEFGIIEAQEGGILPVTLRNQLKHTGAGRPWAIIQTRAAIPLTGPLFAGFK